MKIPLPNKQPRKQQLQVWINQYTDFKCDSLNIVSGDASFRRYFRFTDRGHSIIAVDAPTEHGDVSQFVAVARSYREMGLKVPEVYAYELTQGFYLQQDFGNRQFSDLLAKDSCDQLYAKALARIPLIQNCLSTEKGPLPAFDAAFMEREMNLFKDWLLDKYLQLSLTNTEQSMLDKVLEGVKKSCLGQPMAGMHRDYHSRNLMLLEDDEIGVIDFQDAVVGPITYDAVSLLRDSYQDWPKAKVEQWLQEWHAEHYAIYPWAEFKMWFDCVGMQRHIKIAGIFARLCIRDNKPNFLLDIPHTLGYLIDEASQYPAYFEFASFVRERVLPSVEQKLRAKTRDA